MKIKHPSLPVERDVVDPDPWLAQGWVADAPEPTPEPVEGDDELGEAPPKRRKR